MDKKIIASELVKIAKDLTAKGVNRADNKELMGLTKAHMDLGKLTDHMYIMKRDYKDDKALVQEADGLISVLEDAKKKVQKLMNR